MVSCIAAVWADCMSELCVAAAHDGRPACLSADRDMTVLTQTAQSAFITVLMGPLIKMFRDVFCGSIEMAACFYLQCK